MLAVKLLVEPKVMTSLCPLACSNCGAMSCSADLNALEAKSLISTACACVSMSPNPIMAAMIRTMRPSRSFLIEGQDIRR